MVVAERILKEITILTAELIEAGLCNDQNFPILNSIASGYDEVTFAGAKDLSVTLKNVAYLELYSELRDKKAFNFFMLDGAIIQLQYIVQSNEIYKHRLAFFPSPDLTEYQNDPEIYELDEIYADVVMKNIVTSPMRFDFDREAFVDYDHPMSHLSIGQYKNCRIPVGGPLSPYHFLHFILRAFYNTAFRRCCDNITEFKYDCSPTITAREQRHVHLLVSALR